MAKTPLDAPSAGTPDARLSNIETTWTQILNAHRAEEGSRLAAQQNLLLRYYGAVYRYLLAISRDPVVAEDLAQDFAVRFLRGDFHRADPGRGRFRDLLKTAVRNLAKDYQRKQQRVPRSLDEGGDKQAIPDALTDDSFDKQFLDKWREELLSRAWQGLLAVEKGGGQPYWTLLQRKTEDPKVRSAQLARELSGLLKKPCSEASARQLLHRARELFADLLVEEVIQSAETNEIDKLEQELIELDFTDYCRSALERRRQRRKKKP
jgi:RNA polymerase sigma-70 factor (ECF subfamily)